MKSIVVVGAQWGDEGKGKVVDYLAASFDYIARCAGGHNAGPHRHLQRKPLRPAADPLRDFASRQARGDWIGSGRGPGGTGGRTGHACESRDRHHGTFASVHPRALDFSLSPANGESGRGGARRVENRHDVARNRPGLRRQNGAARNSRRRHAQSSSISRKACPRDFRKGRRVPRNLRRASRYRRDSPISISRWPSGFARSWRMRRS